MEPKKPMSERTLTEMAAGARMVDRYQKVADFQKWWNTGYITLSWGHEQKNLTFMVNVDAGGHKWQEPYGTFPSDMLYAKCSLLIQSGAVTPKTTPNSGKIPREVTCLL